MGEFLIIIIVVALFFLWRNGREAAGYPYRKTVVMSKPEQILYHRLVQALPNHLVLPQVQMCRFLEVTSFMNKKPAFYKISAKSVDYLVTTKDAKVVAAIELQDASHLLPDRAANDAFKRKALKYADVPFIEFHVRKLPSAAEIREALREAINIAG
jgi:hypothetical protein